MPCYIVSYDLRIPNRDYQSLHDAIKAFGRWAKITESTWAIVAEASASDIRDGLEKHLGADDRLFVVKSGSTGAWRNVKCRNEWLKENL